MGKLININNTSKISYSVKFETQILTPTKDITIPCYVSSFNKMGAVAYIKLSDFINDYDAKLLKVGKELAAGDKRERKAAKTTEKIRGKIRELLPKHKRRYGPTKHTKKTNK